MLLSVEPLLLLDTYHLHPSRFGSLSIAWGSLANTMLFNIAKLSMHMEVIKW